MTASDIAGAASHTPTDWHAIDWQQAHRNVRRLQARIVKATQEGRWGKVQALQRLLTHSHSGKVIAVKRVTENQGKKTPGVDQEIWDTPEKKAAAVAQLSPRGYHPQPLRRVYIPKSNGKKRPLGIPTMLDRAMQALYLLALDPVAEVTSDPNSYGFRKERSPADAIEQCFNTLSQKQAAEWILEGDIRACFDRISHDWLVAHVPIDKAILRKWLKAGYMEGKVLHATDEGTPQGGIISPVLANLALNGLEQLLSIRYKGGSRTRKAKIHLVRYADDFIITGNTKEMLENEVKPLVEQFMKERGLELSAEKTTITHIRDGFDFLGQNIRKYGTDGRTKLIIKPARKNVLAFLAKVRKLVKGNKQLPAATLIAQLNKLLRGWANYHQHVVSKETFCKVDAAIFRLLWQWAKRRHPQKSATWIRKKYFKSVGGRNWVFFGETEETNGFHESRLLSVAATPIKRHIKIQGRANPYDPQWESYFEERLGVQMTANLNGRRQLLHLWKEQNGICPICKEKITRITGWNNHHVIWRSRGGADTAENRVLLHPNCHRQLHSQGTTVAKPRPTRGVGRA